MRTLIAVVLALAACAPVGDLTNVSPEIAEGFCGSWEDYRAERDRALAEDAEGARPSVGDTSCRVLAMLGRPHEQTRVDAGSTSRLHWTYWHPWGRPNEKARLIVLRPTPDGRGVVESVVW